jgi:hypothetical protein
MPVAYFDLLISSKWSLVERGRPEEVRLATKGGEKGGAKKGEKKLANLSRKISACHLKKTIGSAMQCRENTEQTEKTEQTEISRKTFRLFRYFRLFRILSWFPAIKS